MDFVLEPAALESRSLSAVESLKFVDDVTGETYWGCDQRWYSTEWQRTAGCGPSVASTIFLYMEGRASGLTRSICRAGCKARMEEIWRYVTPTSFGIPSTAMFADSIRAYGASRGIKMDLAVCDVPEIVGERPEFSEIASFIDDALCRDIPVAFLNLCNGLEKNLDSWHWVTLVSRDGAIGHILDEGEIRIVDLARWRDTTARGGGFVWFSRA